MEDMSCSGESSQGSKQPSAKRRLWSLREEQLLILALKDIIQQGWKCENGFRTGYLAALARYMKRHLPGTDLQADPHIANKIHVWKKHHGSLQTILSRSGFEWDAGNSMVVVHDDKVWDEYVQTDAHAKTIRNKSYPLYNDWCEVFGKDRATGEFAEDLGAADKDPIEVADENDTPEPNMFMHTNSTDHDTASGTEVGASNPKSINRPKKRQREDRAGDEMVNLMGRFCEQTNENLQSIGKRIGYEVMMSEKRGRLFEVLGSLGVLSIDQQLILAKMLINNNKELELFFSLPKEAQGRMVMLMASGRM